MCLPLLLRRVHHVVDNSLDCLTLTSALSVHSSLLLSLPLFILHPHSQRPPHPHPLSLSLPLSPSISLTLTFPFLSSLLSPVYLSTSHFFHPPLLPIPSLSYHLFRLRLLEMASTTITDMDTGASLYSVCALSSTVNASKDLMLTSDYGILKQGMAGNRGKCKC